MRQSLEAWQARKRDAERAERERRVQEEEEERR